MTNKKKRSIFDAVQSMEQEDAVAARQRRKTTEQERQNSQAAVSQSKLFQSLVECRILLQSSLQSSSVDKDECDELLVQLLQARERLSSSTKDDDDDGDNKYEALVKDTKQLEKVLESEYQTQRDEWKQVLNRRQKAIRLQSGSGRSLGTKFLGKSSIDATFWQQVEATVQHDTWRRRQDESNTSFDDTKVYQQLLQEFVRQHAASQSHDLVQTAQERLHSTKSKKKQSKKVDRRASKGRKLRYVPVPKLENFTFPTSRRTETLLEPEEWFKSLFGGVGVSNK